MSIPKYIIRSSFGNDSVALIQWARESRLTDVVVAYSDTGWATPEWKLRVEECVRWVVSLGFGFASIKSKGFERTVYDKTVQGMWPNPLAKFCTIDLKIKPFLSWAEANDPYARAIVLVGVRRAESAARRKAPAFMLENDDGRHVLHPILEFSDEDRDAMVAKTPIPLLSHRSDECSICIHANRKDILRAGEEALSTVERMEAKTGRPMFAPKRKMGAKGIREVRRWAESERGKFVAEESEPGCDDGYCGV